MEMQGDMEKQNRRKEQEYIKGLKRYEQKGIPVYIDGKKPEEEDWEKIFQIQEDGSLFLKSALPGRKNRIKWYPPTVHCSRSSVFHLPDPSPGYWK